MITNKDRTLELSSDEVEHAALRLPCSPKPSPSSPVTRTSPVYYSHAVLLILAVVPPVACLGHQQRDDVALTEAQQGAVVSGRVGEDRLHSGPTVPLQTSRHGAGPWQRTSLSLRGAEDGD